jgi:hypothetical protein
MLLELARTYLNIPVPDHQKAIVALARALAEGKTRATWPREVLVVPCGGM